MNARHPIGQVLFVTCALGCASAGSPADPPASSAPVASITATSVFSVQPTARTPPPARVAVDPSWVAERSDLTAFLLEVGPVCWRSETYESGGSHAAHTYAVYVPSIPRDALVEHLTKVADKLHFTVASDAVFVDGSPRATVFVNNARVSVMVHLEKPVSRSMVADLAHREGMDTERLAAALDPQSPIDGTIVRHIVTGGIVLDTWVQSSTTTKEILAKWAKDEKLLREGESWSRPRDPAAPDLTAIVVTTAKNGTLHIEESRGPTPGGAACQPYQAPDPPRPAGTGPEPSDDELMRQMMGK